MEPVDKPAGENIVSIDAVRPRKRRRFGRKRRRHPVRVLITLLFFTALVTGIVFFIIYRDQLSDDMFADFFSRLRYSMCANKAETAGLISYDDYMLSRFASFKSGLVLLSGDRLSVWGPSGDLLYGADCQFAKPALAVSDRLILAFDRGGTSLLLTDDSSTILKRDLDNVIYTATMNSGGSFALVTAERGYASVCSVFDDHQKEKFIWHSGSHYIIDAALSPSGGALALATGAHDGERFFTRIYLLDTSSEDNPKAAHDFPDIMPISVGFLSEDLFYVVAEECAFFFGGDGSHLFTWPYGESELQGYSAGDGFLALALSGGADTAGTIVLLDGGGQTAETAYSGHLTSLSAAGGWVGFLSDGAAYVFDSGLAPHGQPADAEGALALLMGADGTALLLGQNEARGIGSRIQESGVRS